MRIYLTSGWNNRERMPWLKGWLEKQGHIVVSTWFERDYPPDIPNDWWAPIDLGEIDFADAIVMFTLDMNEECLGAMDFEAGYAFAQDKRLYWIGEPRNMFLARYGQRWPTVPAVPKAKAAA